MDFENAQRQIDSMQRMLKKVKESAAPGMNDPAIMELERIVLRKVGELEAAKTEAREAASFESVLFAPNEEDETEEHSSSSRYSMSSR